MRIMRIVLSTQLVIMVEIFARVTLSKIVPPEDSCAGFKSCMKTMISLKMYMSMLLVQKFLSLFHTPVENARDEIFLHGQEHSQNGKA